MKAIDQRRWKSSFDLYEDFDRYGHPKPVSLDYERLPFCECGESLLQFMRDRFATLFDYPTIRNLDEAIRTLDIEYQARKQTHPIHSLNACLFETYQEIRTLLTQKRDELVRHSHGATDPHLYIGLDDDS